MTSQTLATVIDNLDGSGSVGWTYSASNGEVDFLGAGETVELTFTVTSLADSGAGSLRAAISAANAASGPDTITFQSGLSGTITLSGGELLISDSLAIAGPGASRLTIDANEASRVFHIDDNGPDDRAYSISGLTITGGKIATSGEQDSGGGLYLEPAFDRRASSRSTASRYAVRASREMSRLSATQLAVSSWTK